MGGPRNPDVTVEDEKTVAALLRLILDEMKKLNAAASRRAAATNGATVASDYDLDSQYGDEQVKFSPRDWTGADIKGLPMSNCPPEALDLLANAFDFFAKKNEGKMTDKGKPKSDFDKRSASRARGWAIRLRAGWKPRQASTSTSSGADFDDASFEPDEFGDAMPDL